MLLVMGCNILQGHHQAKYASASRNVCYVVNLEALKLYIILQNINRLGMKQKIFCIPIFIAGLWLQSIASECQTRTHKLKLHLIGLVKQLYNQYFFLGNSKCSHPNSACMHTIQHLACRHQYLMNMFLVKQLVLSLN